MIVSKGRLALLVAVAAVFAAVAAGAMSMSSVASTPNLLGNPGFEDGPAGTGGVVSIPEWLRYGCSNITVVRYASPGGFPHFGSPGPADRGFAFAAGGPGCPDGANYLYQVIDLRPHATPINAGLTEFSLTAWLGGFKHQKDRAIAVAAFFKGPPTAGDCTGKKTGQFSTGAVWPSDRAGITGLLPRAVDNWVPHASQCALVWIEFIRVNGAYNDGYADSLDFHLIVHQVTP